MLTKDKVQLLAQLIQALDDAVTQMDQYKSSKDSPLFEKAKNTAKGFQAKIGELLQT